MFIKISNAPVNLGLDILQLQENFNMIYFLTSQQLLHRLEVISIKRKRERKGDTESDTGRRREREAGRQTE